MTHAGADPTPAGLAPVGGTQAIGRTLAVLDLFRQEGRDLGISEIAEHLSLSASTVHRIVRALVNAAYLAQNAASERYYLGRAAVLLGQSAGEQLGLDRAQAVLDRVREDTGESVNLGVREGDQMMVVIRAESKLPLRFSQEPGSKLPVHATAMGKASLAHAGSSIASEVAGLRKPLEALTPHTITSPTKLRQELERIRSRGYSIDDEEALLGVRCVAAPILSPAGHLLAAVAVQGPAVRMSAQRLDAFAPVIRAVADEIARVLPTGHRL